MPQPRTADLACFNCGSGGTRLFYSIDGVPAHSCLLMPTRNEAVDYARGDLRLYFCDACGFIQNNAYDPTLEEYSPRYEETQSFSGRFNEFARSLATDYVKKYAPRKVLEIGCGKGEFLVLLCEIGDCEGIGIDPGCQPDRIVTAAKDRIEFIVDYYSEKYAHLQADMVLCRHTLEHIQPTQEFMSLIRRSIGERTDTVVCFELPDTERILVEQAFWDIYYEHCSYFTLGSLARLFKNTGYRVTELQKTYEDQYLLIDAVPSGEPDETVLPQEDDLARIRELAGQFERSLPGKLDEWRRQLSEARSRREKVVLWGSGSKAASFLTTLGLGDEVTCVTDINPYRHGMFMPGSGHEIVPPPELKRVRPDWVIAMNPVYLREIGNDLEAMGLEPRLTAL